MKHLSNFLRTLDMPLINCEVSLTLTWFKNCVLTDMTTKAAEGDNLAIISPTGATFTITDAKLHAPVVTISVENDNKLLQQFKAELKKQLNEINI